MSRFLGEIVRLQVQTAELKTGPLGRRTYDPSPIRTSETLYLTEDGVEGLDASGFVLSDVHNRLHPSGKNRDGVHGVSILFTSHYRRIRDRFGPHVVDGNAGESILVDSDGLVGPEDMQSGVVIETENGPACLALAKPAEPCVEFTRFCLRRPAGARADRMLNDALVFLRDGARGYYLIYNGPPATFRAGQRVYLA